MNSMEQILEANKDVYLWGDKKTLDVEVNDEALTIIEELIKYICLRCGKNVLTKESKLLKSITSSDTGAQVKCNCCSQDYFIHKPISIPKSLSNN